ncbi:unnamed protein product, partial [Rotaria sp. Silwood2]
AVPAAVDILETVVDGEVLADHGKAVVAVAADALGTGVDDELAAVLRAVVVAAVFGLVEMFVVVPGAVVVVEQIGSTLEENEQITFPGGE